MFGAVAEGCGAEPFRVEQHRIASRIDGFTELRRRQPPEARVRAVIIAERGEAHAGM